MATMAEIRTGLKANLDTIPNIQVNAYVLANPSPPCLQVAGGPIQYDRAMGRGLDEIFFTVQAYVQMVLDEGAQINLDLLAAPTGSTSVKAALEADRTLGGKVGGLHVTEVTEERVYELNGRPAVLGREFTVRILASN